MNQITDWLRTTFGKSSGDEAPGERDVSPDYGTARSRATGGDPTRHGGDSESTTGPGENGTFVGRVAGNDDEGSVGETGAEARSEQARKQANDNAGSASPTSHARKSSER